MAPSTQPITKGGLEPGDVNFRDQDFSFSVTGYEGFEAEILRLRNSNRPTYQGRTYLDWRYGGQPEAVESRIFWVMSALGERIGMASVICRLYWIDGEPSPLAVLGDISLDVAARGKGVGMRLLAFVTNYVKTEMPNVKLAFVIPNELAQRSLATVGWKTAGTLVTYVFIADCAGYFARRIPFHKLAILLARIASKLLAWLPSLHFRPEFTIDVPNKFDESLGEIWAHFPKREMIIRDMTFRSVCWRYVSHPNIEFKVAKFMKSTCLFGYVIFAIAPEERTCQIYDLLVLDQKTLNCMLALFLRYCQQGKEVSSVRLLLNDSHPYRKGLWRLGFIPRGKQGVVQVYSRSRGGQVESSGWRLTMGDKDI